MDLNFMKNNRTVSKLFGALGLALVLAVGGSTSSCCHHDDREPVLPPVVKEAPNTLAGVVTDIAGNPVSGAKVTVGSKSATTGADGGYTISEVAQGRQHVTASANGMYSASADINFSQANNQNLVWSVSLNKKTEQDLTVKDGKEEAKGDVKSENIPNNEEGSVNITVEVPANTVPDNTTIKIAPIYSTADAVGTKAGENETMLIGANVTCSDPAVTLTNPIDVVFALDASVAQEVVTKEFDIASNTWRDVKPEVGADGKVTIKTTKFTSFGIFLPVSVTTTSSYEEIKFDQSVFDNRNGGDDMFVEAASFSYKAGASISVKAKNKLEGLLIEYLARLYGAKVNTMKGSYPIGITLEVGQGLVVKGTQAVDKITVSSKKTSVTGTRYGNVSVSVSPFSVDHNGGVVGD